MLQLSCLAKVDLAIKLKISDERFTHCRDLFKGANSFQKALSPLPIPFQISVSQGKVNI